MTNNIEIHNNQNYQIILKDACSSDPVHLWEDTYNEVIYNVRSDIKWKRPKEVVNNPRFIREKIDDVPSRFSLTNIDFGHSKYINVTKLKLAVFSALTLDSKVFRLVLPEDNVEFHDATYAGVFHFRFWKFGKLYDVVVDDRLPTRNGKLVSYFKDGSPEEFWPVLLEKAYFKLFGSAETPGKLIASEFYTDLTGGIAETYVTLGHTKPPLIDLETILRNASDRGSFILFGRQSHSKSYMDKNNVYCVTKTVVVDNDKAERIMLLRIFMPFITENKEWQGPWSEGSDEWKSISKEKKAEIGVLRNYECWIPFSEFIKHDWDIHVVHSSSPPSENIESVSNRGFTWSLLSVKSKWVKGVNSGGNRRDHLGSTFHLNPQFMLSLELADGDCELIVSALQKTSKGDRNRVPVYLYIFNMKQKTEERLNMNFFKHSQPMQECLSRPEAREVSMSLKIPTGEYCVVVAPEKPHQEAQFMLRVLADKNITMHEVKEKVIDKDTDVRVSFTPTMFEGESVNSDEAVHTFFEKESGEDNVVGWRGLKRVLDFALHNEKPKSDRNSRSSFIYYLFPSKSVFDTMDDKEFSYDLSRSLLAMADFDHSGKITLKEFKDLWSQVRQWIQIYEMYSDDSGFLPKEHLKEALDSAGFQLNSDILCNLAIRYSNRNNVIPFDDFLMCSSKLRTVFDYYRFKDPEYTDQAVFTLDEWLRKSIYS